MISLYFFLGCALAYLIGSIPTSVWIGRSFYDLDVREHGSGNAGATNTFRVLGRKAGIIVMVIDVLKGFLASALAGLMVSQGYLDAKFLVHYKLIFGLCAVLGHIFPIYVGFKGGKGVATLLGMVLAIHPVVALLCVLIFLITLIATKYVSLSSIVATLAFPILNLLEPFNLHQPVLIIFGFAAFGGLLYTHRNNLKRILKGEENKTYLKPKRK